MGNYIYLNSKNKKGQLGVSKNVFKDIAEVSLKQINGVSETKRKSFLFFKSESIDVNLTNNTVKYKIYLDIDSNLDKEEIVRKYKEILKNNLLYLLDISNVSISIILK